MPQPPLSSVQKPKLFDVLRPYRGRIIVLIALALVSNALTLVVPKLIAHGIDAYQAHTLVLHRLTVEFLLLSGGIFLFTYMQSIVQTYVSEKVARNMRTRVAAKISRQSYMAVDGVTPGKLLTTLTSDIDSVKLFVAQAIVSIFSSLFIIIGVSVLLITIDWRLAVVVLLSIPLIGGTFFFVLSKVRPLFSKSRGVIDWLNKVINESILGAALIRVLNAKDVEYEKFGTANTEAKAIGLKILGMFATLIPIITFVANLAMLAILSLGGKYVIAGSLSIGNFAAFMSYVALLIFPILIIGFMSNIIAQASASYVRVHEVLSAPEPALRGTITTPLTGALEVQGVQVTYGDRTALRDITFTVTPGTKTAIIGPTAAGKTQLLYALIGLITPQKGSITYDGIVLADYDPVALHQQIGFVFQESSVFNMSLRENIAFTTAVGEAALTKAINAAELNDFIATLPEGIETVVSERGTTLSGGQKQRLMLARALALNPRILLLDDFTARVDAKTEMRILNNIAKEYPETTLISVTQKIAAIEHYDHIIVLMEGELLAQGTHAYLLEHAPEYVQIYNSQRSTTAYEV